MTAGAKKQSVASPVPPVADELSKLQTRVRHLENECELTRREYEDTARNYLDTLTRIEKQKNELEILNAHLEDRVLERTRLLEESNEKLREREKRAVDQRSAIAFLALDNRVVDGDLEQALQRIAAVSAATIGVARVGIWKLSDLGPEMNALALCDPDQPGRLPRLSIDTRDYPRYFHTLSAENRINAENAQADLRTRELAAGLLVPNGIASILHTAVLVDGRLTGIVCFDHVGPRRAWLPDEESFAGTIAALVAQLFATERHKRAAEENNRLEEQLIHAQKMDAVGQLAGGVAHDFNNMLAVVMGNAELALESVAPNAPTHGFLKEILKATDRSANLTRQLLAFARKQTAEPQILDLNDTLAGMLKMLRRLLGENISLVWKPSKNLGFVKIDPSQIDQILVNLCVNARDAIGKTGRISIKTCQADIEAIDGSPHSFSPPGKFVRMTVEDNGCGMDAQTISHIFEPFFTTKEVGRGTGLGLATVYGIVKQNGGFIEVDSTPGSGATFNVYLPRHEAPDESAVPETPMPASRTGHETILLVEDEPTILHMVCSLLERQGFNVLAAARPNDAIRIAKRHSGTIDLLLTDVVMPQMNGCDLAARIDDIRPGTRRLFMSGHTTEVLSHHGILNEGIHFIPKPFSATTLAAKISEALAGR